MKTLAIVISYNFMSWIDRCLPSLLKGKHPTDILVVDNGSSDETISYIHEHYPSIRLIENKKNLGFGNLFLSFSASSNVSASICG